MRRVAVIVIAVIVLAGVFALSRRQSAPSAEEGMRTAEVTQGDLLVSVSATGSVQPAATVEVRSRATGTVTDVQVQEGQRVAKGQVLVELDDPDARSAVRSAQASVASATAQVRQLSATLAADRVDYQNRVRSAEAAVALARARLDELRAGSTPNDLTQAQEAVRQAEANLALSRDNLRRQEQLYRDGFVARAAVDEARVQVQVDESRLRAALARLEDVRAGPRTQEIAQAAASLQQAIAQRDQVRASSLQFRAREAGIAQARAQLAMARSNLASAQERLAESRIAAPIAGVVVKKSVDVGQSVIGGSGGGTLVLVLAQVEPLLAVVNVDESDIARIRIGMPVELTADALPDAAFRGRVQQIAPRSEVVQNVTQFEVQVAVDHPDPSLRLGMTIDAEFIIARRQNVLLIPQEAVRGKEQPAVFVIEDGRRVTRLIKTGLSDGRNVEVLEGLRLGEVVYLGPARQTQQQAPQGRSPFQPQFPPRQPRR